MANYILYDCPPDAGFIDGLEKASGCAWTPLYADGRASVARFTRIRRYFLFPLLFLLRRRDARRILAWQQFYGILAALYSPLLTRRKHEIYISTFIYRPRSGMLGKIYRGIINAALGRREVKKIFVYSESEARRYADLFPKAASKFRFVPLGIPQDIEFDEKIEPESGAKPFIFSAGRSNRDYAILKEAAEKGKVPVVIACPEEKSEGYEMTEVLTDCFEMETERRIRQSIAVAIPLRDKHFSSGQLVALQAMRAGKPLIVSDNEALAEYIIEGETALVCRQKEDWERNLKQLYNDPELCRRLGENGFRLLRERFSLSALGKSIGEAIGK